MGTSVVPSAGSVTTTCGAVPVVNEKTNPPVSGVPPAVWMVSASVTV